MKVHVLSLGCARTLVDSEHLSGILTERGHSLTDSLPEAECVVVNTCAFIREAEEESIRVILDVAGLKKSGSLKKLYVVGCLPQKRKSESRDLLSLLPEVDGFLGTGDLVKLPRLMEEGRKQRFFVTSPVPTLLFESRNPRRRMTPAHFAYAKLSEGCDHACTFCSIPQFRGKHRSRTIEDLLKEARHLAEEGVVELNLIGQDTSYYGADLYGKPCLPQLLEVLSGAVGIRWIRLLYAHPAHVTKELIAAIRDLPNVVKYIDIPLQHIADPLLAAMRRETDGAYIRNLIEEFRKEIPGVALRSTFIVGFPGETDAHVKELAEFMKEAQFERVGIFSFSPEPKTPAERMEAQVPEAVKKERLDYLMELQQGISEEINRQWLGREIEVLIDEKTEDSVYLGRSYADAPEVDGEVHVKSRRPLTAGQFVQAKVVDTYEYDLVAEVIDVVGHPRSGCPPTHRAPKIQRALGNPRCSVGPPIAGPRPTQ